MDNGLWQGLALLALGALALVGAAGIGFIYGVAAGRHDLPPAPALIALKDTLQERLGLARRWRRHIHTDPGAAQLLACPPDAFVIVTGGQSNAANSLSDPVDADPSVPAFMAYQGRCYRLADPLLGASDQRGSLWAALGQAYAKASGRPVLMVNGAVGATRTAHWLDPSSGYMARLAQAVRAVRERGHEPHLILWHQGEADGMDEASVDAFQARFAALTNAIFNALDLQAETRLVLYRTSLCAARWPHPNTALTTAIAHLAEADTRVVLGPDTDRLDHRHRYDRCHFNARGRAAIVAATLPLLAAADPAAAP